MKRSRTCCVWKKGILIVRVIAWRSLAVFLERTAKPDRSPRIVSFRARANGNSQQQQLPFISASFRACPFPRRLLSSDTRGVFPLSLPTRAILSRTGVPKSRKLEISIANDARTPDVSFRYRYLWCEFAAAPANLIAYLRIFRATKLVTHATNFPLSKINTTTGRDREGVHC